MDPTFIMGSLGQMTGEKNTRLFEKATEKRLLVVPECKKEFYL